MKTEFQTELNGVNLTIRYETEDFENDYDSTDHQIEVLAGGVDIITIIDEWNYNYLVEQCRDDYDNNHKTMSRDQYDDHLTDLQRERNHGL